MDTGPVYKVVVWTENRHFEMTDAMSHDDAAKALNEIADRILNRRGRLMKYNDVIFRPDMVEGITIEREWRDTCAPIEDYHEDIVDITPDAGSAGEMHLDAVTGEASLDA